MSDRHFARRLVALLALSVAGCSGTSEPGTTPGFTLALIGSAVVTVVQEGTTSAGVTITRVGGFAGAVGIAVEGATGSTHLQ